MIRKYIEKIGENRNIEDMQKLGDMLAEIIYETKENHPEIYKKYKSELYEMAFGKKINEEMAEKWVESMKPYGQKWTMEETTKVLRDKNWILEPIDFYVVLNMMFNDYNNIILDNYDLAFEMAKDWLNDVDTKDNKLYNYYKYVV